MEAANSVPTTLAGSDLPAGGFSGEPALRRSSSDELEFIDGHTDDLRHHHPDDAVSVFGFSLNQAQTRRHLIREAETGGPIEHYHDLHHHRNHVAPDLPYQAQHPTPQNDQRLPQLDGVFDFPIRSKDGSSQGNPSRSLKNSSFFTLPEPGRSSSAHQSLSSDTANESFSSQSDTRQKIAEAAGTSATGTSLETDDYLPTDQDGGNHYSLSPQATNIDIHRPKQLLRRATSHGSLALSTTLSATPSLGDSTNWDNVHSQVNSRAKAFKDSLADSSFHLPKIPSLASIKPSSFLDLASLSRRGSLKNKAPSGRAHTGSERDMPGGDLQTLADTGTTAPHGPSNKSAQSHPQLTRALQDLTGDVVILGGYRGSILRSAEPPHRQVWVPIKVGLNLRKVDLELGLHATDDLTETDRIFPSGMVTHIGPVDISRRLFKRMRACRNAVEGRLRVWDFGYDWRLNPQVLSQHLTNFLEGLPSNSRINSTGPRGALVIAHSLGGLITRHAVNQKPHLFSGVIYAGVPQTCVNILGPLRNGDDVLLSSRVLTAQVNFTIRTSYALLPLDGKCFINRETREEYPVDFFDAKTWEEYRLSPCMARPLPPLTPKEGPRGRVGSIVGSMASVLPKAGRRGASPRRSDSMKRDALANEEDAARGNGDMDGSTSGVGMAPQMDNKRNNNTEDSSSETNVATKVTIPHAEAAKYLQRTLNDVKKFKENLAHRPEYEEKGLYPPAAIIYSKNTPTVVGAYVRDREAIKHADAYDNLAFASGDGVVLARAAQLPEGYKLCKQGMAESDRGHVTLLGDLEAVGKCLNAVLAEQRRRAGRV